MSQPRRCWDLANEKLEREPFCRNCGTTERVQRAHTVGREYDPTVIGPRGGKLRMVPAEAILPLCGGCHFRYDAFGLSILDLVNEDEYRYACEALGEERARKRLSGGTA